MLLGSSQCVSKKCQCHYWTGGCWVFYRGFFVTVSEKWQLIYRIYLIVQKQKSIDWTFNNVEGNKGQHCKICTSHALNLLGRPAENETSAGRIVPRLRKEAKYWRTTHLCHIKYRVTRSTKRKAVESPRWSERKIRHQALKRKLRLSSFSRLLGRLI